MVAGQKILAIYTRISSKMYFAFIIYTDLQAVAWWVCLVPEEHEGTSTTSTFPSLCGLSNPH